MSMAQADREPGARRWELRILDAPEEMAAVEQLSRQVWPGSDLEVVPAHLLLTAAHNGGVVVGAFAEGVLVGFAFGFPGLIATPQGWRLKHCSHQLGVQPDYRNSGLGFALKRAQWEFVRGQGLDRVTWTYDPLLSRNAHLNIAKLGAVCNTYLRNAYGTLRDELNAGLPSDRFQVDWWVNSERVEECMREGGHLQDLAGYLAAGAELLNPPASPGSPVPPEPSAATRRGRASEGSQAILLLEIPTDFLALKQADPDLALSWRLGTRAAFESLFSQGFMVTDFLYQAGPPARALYVLSPGNEGSSFWR